MGSLEARLLVLRAVPGTLAVCRLPVEAPDLAAVLQTLSRSQGPVLSITRTPSEVSIVCAADQAPAEARVEAPWRAFAVDGVLDFAQVGVLMRLTSPLAAAGVPVFALSTYDTDYLLVPDDHVDAAVRAWLTDGLGVADEDAAPG